MAQIPRWTDEEGKLELVKEELSEEERQDAMIDYDVPGLRLPEWYWRLKQLPPEKQRKYHFLRAEREALQAAEHGDFSLLRALTDPEHELNAEPPRIRDHLSPKAWVFINQRLDGKKIGNPGAKKKPPDERGAFNPVHAAPEDLMPEVAAILRRHYPDRREVEIKDCACRFTAQLADIDEDRLRNYIASSRKDRRRI